MQRLLVPGIFPAKPEAHSIITLASMLWSFILHSLFTPISLRLRDAAEEAQITVTQVKKGRVECLQ